MIVEDEPLIRAGLKKYFDWKALGVHTIIEAPNGKKGLELSLQESPDLIITDIQMPIMDGLEMIKRIRTQQPDMVFIILTGFNEFEYAQKAIQYGGVHDFLLKPLQRDKSYRSIENCISLLNKKQPATYVINKEENQKEDDAEDNEFVLFQQIEKYVIENINADLSLNAVALHFFYNPSYLSRHFKEKLNVNYLDFLKEIKIKVAQQYLQKGDLSITDVSRKSGFNSYKNFSKTFRNITDMTPTEFRRHIRL